MLRVLLYKDYNLASLNLLLELIMSQERLSILETPPHKARDQNDCLSVVRANRRGANCPEFFPADLKTSRICKRFNFKSFESMSSRLNSPFKRIKTQHVTFDLSLLQVRRLVKQYFSALSFLNQFEFLRKNLKLNQ